VGAAANTLNFDCDWRLGFNLAPGLQGTIGYLLTWNGCGGLNLQKDIEIWNPFNAAGQTVVTGPKVQCIGLIDTFRYDGGDNDPIRIKCYVSKGTAADVRAKLATPLSNTKLKVAWYIIDYDSERKGWYEAAFVKSPVYVDANIDTAGGNLQLFISNTAVRISETLDIRVYALEFQIVPAEGSSADLEFATGPTRRLVKSWTDAE
jgi:hypothetical protein